MQLENRSLKIKTIHEIDSIYYGSINASYQKEGFGIQQTCDFQTYIGFWKNNKADGLGLIIYPTGSMIYGNFNRDQLFGIAVVDDRINLRCGVFEKLEIIGIGFQFSYEKRVWRMSKYHKGVPIESIKEQAQIREDTPPKLINIEQSLYHHLTNYFDKNYFGDLSKQVYHKMGSNMVHYGFMEKDQYYGPGIIFEKGLLKQVGFYESGLLHGYALRYFYENQYSEIGQYSKGRKEGVFIEKTKDKEKFVEYRRNNATNSVDEASSELVKKRQKKYNYESKDFYSSKATLPFKQIQEMFTSPQVRAYEIKKQLQKHQKKDHSPTRVKKSLPKKDDKNYYIVENNERSSVQIIKQKIKEHKDIIEQVSSDRSGYLNNRKNTKVKIELSQSPPKKDRQAIEDEIAEQENPFSPIKISN